MLASPDDWVVMARIAAPWGVKGWVKVQPFSQLDDALADYPVWQLRQGAGWLAYNVEAFQAHGNQMVAKLAGVNDRDAAFALRGAEIGVPKSSLPPAGNDEYYWSDLLGLQVINLQGQVLGRVSRMLEAGAHDVLVVATHAEPVGELLIPFVGAIVRQVDLTARTIQVDWQADY